MSQVDTRGCHHRWDRVWRVFDLNSEAHTWACKSRAVAWDAIAKCIVQSLGLSVETEQTWAESPGERYRRSGLGHVVLDGTEGTTLSVQSDAQLHGQNRS